MSYILNGSFKLVPERQEYIGVISKVEGTTLTVVAIGAEASEFDILNWIKETIAIMRGANATNVQAPDMYDRARGVQKH